MTQEIEQVTWWECETCGYKNEPYFKFCTQCGKAKPVVRDPELPWVRLDLGCGGNKRKDEDGKGEWIGVDCIAFPGVDQVVDLCERTYKWKCEYVHSEHDFIVLRNSAHWPEEFGMVHPVLEKVHTGYKIWPFADDSVDEIHAAHFLEHFGGWDRVHIFNEMYRILRVGGKAEVVVPSWTSARAYGDPTHVWSPIGVYSFFYLWKGWRMGGGTARDGSKVEGAQAPHTDASNVKFGYSCDFDFDVTTNIHPNFNMNAYTPERMQEEMTFKIEVVQDIRAVLTKLPKERPK